jgi:hypothetical protein
MLRATHANQCNKPVDLRSATHLGRSPAVTEDQELSLDLQNRLFRKDQINFLGAVSSVKEERTMVEVMKNIASTRSRRL